ncbi:phage/plasmid replication protein, gene II/X family [Pseudomonas aeruginosa]|nr:phage/plasmid replication protein, gene II/X family [Pseudomonas aeruginosa]
MFKWLAGSYPDLFREARCVSDAGLRLGLHVFQPTAGRTHALQVIQALTNVSNGHTKSRGDNYQTSAYWGAKESRLKRLKAYLKHTEFQAQLDELKRAGRADLSAARSARVMSDPRLQEWVRYLLRMEATVMHRWLERRGIPSRLLI